jgi:hypothetical protein
MKELGFKFDRAYFKKVGTVHHFRDEKEGWGIGQS